MPDRMYADEWLPSRFGLGSLRLIGYAISRSLERDRPVSGAYVNRERHQHPLEPTILTILYWIVPGLHISIAFGTSRESAMGAIAAFIVALVFVPVAWIISGFLFTPLAKLISNIVGVRVYQVQLRVPPLLMFALSIWSVAMDWPSLLIGWVWIGLTVLEALARLVCLPLRSRFAALDRRIPTESP